MPKALRWFDLITINIYFTGLTILSQTMTPLVVPLLIQQFVGDEQKGGSFGSLRLWTLMTALLVQSLMGTLSDHNPSRWGRRRPFILAGTLASLVFIAGIGFSAGMQGTSGYWFLFTMLILLMASSNTAHGAAQGLIPDLVPENKRGIYSGVKALLEIPIPLIIVSFTVGMLISAGNIWGALLVAMAFLVITMAITMFVPEKQMVASAVKLDWRPFMRLVLMTALFTIIILGTGQVVRIVGSWAENRAATEQILWMGLTGLAAMVICIALGVYFSVQIGIGKDAKDNSSYRWWVINRLAFLVGSTNLASFAVYYLQGRLGLEAEAAAGPASRLILLVGVFILLLAVPSGWLADKLGPKPLVAASGFIAAAGVLVLLLTTNIPVIYLGGILIGAATGIFYSANWALGTDLVPKMEAGRYLGISNLAGAGAGAVGAYIGGPIADFFTTTQPGLPGLGYSVLFAIYGAIFIISVLALIKVKHHLA